MLIISGILPTSWIRSRGWRFIFRTFIFILILWCTTLNFIPVFVIWFKGIDCKLIRIKSFSLICKINWYIFHCSFFNRRLPSTSVSFVKWGMLSKLSLTKILNTWTINSLFTKYRYTYYIYNYIYIFIHTHFQNIANAKYIFNIYTFSLIKKLINDACKFHIKGTTSFCYHLRVVGHNNTPAFAWCCQSH